MNILAIIAQPSNSSLSHTILEKLLSMSENANHSITVRDLYKLNFNPVLSSQDLNSYRNSEIADDIIIEQKLISNAELIIIIYPIWWGGMPAILKGYIDRVFSLNFAYKIENDTAIPLLSDKKVICISTQGETKEKYEANGMYAAMEKIFIDGIFSFCGINTAKFVYFEEFRNLDENLLAEKYLEIKNILEKCETF